MTIASEFLNELEACLNQPGLGVVSCDVFDTLIFRAAGTPEQCWLSLARQAYQQGIWPDDDPWAFVALRKAAEEEARAINMKLHHHQEVMLVDIYACWPSSVSDALIALESEFEYKTWRLNRSLVGLLLQRLSTDKKFLLISDMYLSSELILRFFLEHAPELSIAAIYVSGECGLSKRKGDLFPYVFRDQSVSPDEVLHIGDDRISDKQMAIAAGVHTFHASLGDDYIAQIKYEQRLCSQSVHGLEHLRKQWIWDAKDNSAFSRLGGLVYGPVLCAFARWVVARCQQRGIKKIFCLLREGELISHLIKLVPGHSLMVKTLAVSRRSSFLPSQMKWSPDMLHSLAQRRGYTLNELLEDIGLDCPKEWSDLACRPLAKLIELAVWSDIYVWVENRQIVIENYLQQQRIWLQIYLKQQGVENSPENAILDWGCGGSLLYNLCNVAALDNVEYFMFYSNAKALKVALQLRLNVFQPGHSASWSTVMANSPELSEILLNGSLASTRAYHIKNERAQPVAVTKPLLQAEQAINLDRFQHAVLQWAGLAADNNWLSSGLDVFEREFLFGILYRLIQYPTWLEAEMLKWLPVPFSCGVSNPLIENVHIKKLQTLADNGTQAFAIGRDALYPFVRQCWWYPGVVSLTFPGQLQCLGEVACSQDDEKVGPFLLQQLQQCDITETAIYGAGELGLSVYNMLVSHGISINCVIDRRAETTDFKLAEHDVITLERAKLKGIKCFTVASRAYAYEITSYIRKEYSNDEALCIFSYLSVRDV